MFGAAFRDPVRAAVLYDANSGNDTAKYDAFFVNDPDTNTAPINIFKPNNLAANVMTFPVIAYFQSDSTNSWNPHGTLLGSGELKGENGWFFANANGTTGDTVNIAISGLDVGNSMDVTMFKLVGQGKVEEQRWTAQGNGTLAITFQDSGYRLIGYSMSLSSSSFDQTFVQITMTIVIVRRFMLI